MPCVSETKCYQKKTVKGYKSSLANLRVSLPGLINITALKPWRFFHTPPPCILFELIVENRVKRQGRQTAKSSCQLHGRQVYLVILCHTICSLKYRTGMKWITFDRSVFEQPFIFKLISIQSALHDNIFHSAPITKFRSGDPPPPKLNFAWPPIPPVIKFVCWMGQWPMAPPQSPHLHQSVPLVLITLLFWWFIFIHKLNIKYPIKYGWSGTLSFHFLI